MWRAVLVALLLACVAAGSSWASAKLQFDEEFIPRFNVPRMSKPPVSGRPRHGAGWKWCVR